MYANLRTYLFVSILLISKASKVRINLDHNDHSILPQFIPASDKRVSTANRDGRIVQQASSFVKNSGAIVTNVLNPAIVR